MMKTFNGVRTEFRYDGEDLILTINDAGAITGSWTFGPGIDNPLAMNRYESNYYYVKDWLGSVVVLADSSGTVTQTYEYSVFGEITKAEGNVDNPFTYTAREWEPEVGLYYYRARFFNPVDGRFVNEDPLWLYGGDLNLYRYAINSPVVFKDPYGNTWTTGEPIWHGSLKRNTIVCDGKGGVTTFIGNPGAPGTGQSGCLYDCIQVHENSHRNDALKSNKNICKGKAYGAIVAPTETNERLTTDMTAYAAEMKCLKKKLEDAGKCDSSNCKDFLRQRIDQLGGLSVGQLGRI